MSTNAKPARRRSLSTAKTGKAPTGKLLQLAAQTYKSNSEQNAAKRTYEKNRKDLFKEMKHEGITAFDAEVLIDGKTVTVHSAISTPIVNFIDVRVLKGLVDEDTFLKIVSASKAAVEEYAGTSIAAQCQASDYGTENVSVKAVK